MPAYVVMDIDVHDPQGFGHYVEQATPLIARFGGRNLLLDLNPSVLEGKWEPSSLVIQEFPDADAVRRWWDSPEYQPLKVLRRQYSAVDLVVGRTRDQGPV